MPDRGGERRRPAPYAWDDRPNPITGAAGRGTGIGQVEPPSWHDRVREVVGSPGALDGRELGTGLRKAREAAGLSQRQLAALLRIRQSQLSETETGKRRLRVAEMLTPSLYLRVPLADLAPESIRELLREAAAEADTRNGANGVGDA
jgi:hypothetical protein